MSVALLVGLTFLAYSDAAQFQCKDDQGYAVSWWLAIKMPAGYEYLFATALDPTLTKSSYVMDDPSGGALAHTMNQLWQTGAQWVAFNDNPAQPDSNTTKTMIEAEMNEFTNFTAGNTAHSKGVFSFNEGYGFWLTHSVPNWPLTPRQVSSFQGLSSNAGTYGQHLFCVSMTEIELNDVASQIVIDAPDVYAYSFTSATLSKYTGISDLANENFPSSSICNVEVIGIVTMFAKTQYWGKDLWASCVGPHYKSDLLVETWLRGLEIGSSCPPSFAYDTMDVEYVDFGAYGWKETQDHAKWAVGVQGGMVCFGDINRMTSQFARGGGATCIKNNALWTQFNQAVTAHTAC